MKKHGKKDGHTLSELDKLCNSVTWEIQRLGQ